MTTFEQGGGLIGAGLGAGTGAIIGSTSATRPSGRLLVVRSD